MNTFILSVCIISLAVSLCDNLTSGTRLGKQVKFILSLILLCVIFRPLGIPDMPDIPDIPELEQYSEDFLSQETADLIAENISRRLADELSKNNISADFISTDINISDSDSISINRVTVGTDNFSQAEKIIKSNLGEETEVLNGYD